MQLNPAAEAELVTRSVFLSAVAALHFELSEVEPLAKRPMLLLGDVTMPRNLPKYPADVIPVPIETRPPRRDSLQGGNGTGAMPATSRTSLTTATTIRVRSFHAPEKADLIAYLI